MTTASYYRHIHCDNDPEYLQGFRAGPNGPGAPQAGVRCEGCDRPTAVYDWVEVVDDVNGEARAGRVTITRRPDGAHEFRVPLGRLDGEA